MIIKCNTDNTLEFFNIIAFYSSFHTDEVYIYKKKELDFFYSYHTLTWQELSVSWLWLQDPTYEVDVYLDVVGVVTFA